MTHTDDFPSTIAYAHPSSGLYPGHAADQLGALREEALREGRQDDADGYEHMMRSLSSRMRGQREDISLTKKAALAIVVSIVLALAVRYFV